MSEMDLQPRRSGSEPIVLLDPALPMRGMLVVKPQGLFSGKFCVEVEYEMKDAAPARPVQKDLSRSRKYGGITTLTLTSCVIVLLLLCWWRLAP